MNTDDTHCVYFTTVHFCNNTSVEGGDSIYGGTIDQCSSPKISRFDSLYGVRIIPFDNIIEICNDSDSSSAISSKANRLCFCNNSEVTCKPAEMNVIVTPGRTLELSTVAVGQRYGITIATVKASLIIPLEEQINKPLPYISELQRRQEVNRICTKLLYTINAPVGTQKLLLSISDLSADDATENLKGFRESKKLPTLVPYSPEVPLLIYVTVEDCYLGFVYNQMSLQCDCHPYLKRRRVQCNVDNQTIQRSGSLWVNAINNTITIHRHCPLGYCNTVAMELSLSTPSDQCLFNRSGTLCGECRGNLSQVLGSLDCKDCSKFWLFLVIPLTVVSGILLVLFLTILNLTVSTGAINGLIFYANIVRANNAIFFNSQTLTITSISSVFIAWINLDLGIEVCFYNGLDAYAKTIFQLAFPLYICAITGTIILLSHYFTIATKLSGRNAVQVLATLFLLSYSKTVRLVITSLSFTTLTIQHYPNDTNTSRIVWLYDGNVDYLQGKHIALFLIGILILVLVSLPYTTILIISQCLERKSHYKGMSWVWKIKPLLDAYTGPYKNKHRYWTGLLLLVRVVLYAIFSLNFAGDPAINLLAISILMLLTMTYLMHTGGVYKSWPLSTLESAFLLNLAMLSTSTLFAIQANSNQEIIINISVILNIGIFCGILVYHVCIRIKNNYLKFYRRYKNKRSFGKKDELLCENEEPQEEEPKEVRTVTSQVLFFNHQDELVIETEHNFQYPEDN